MNKIVNFILGLIVVISLIGYTIKTIPALTALAAYGIGLAVGRINNKKKNE